MTTPRPVLSRRFSRAVAVAVGLHARQPRKDTSIPYVSHLLAVAALVLEDGGSEDEAIAAILHDAVEDQGGPPTLRKIHRRFGARVASIVAGCSDSHALPKPPWRKRKQQYIAHLRTAPRGVLLVKAADALHNTRSILSDYRRHGDRLWRRFKGGQKGTVWYVSSVASTLNDRLPKSRNVEELGRIVAELTREAGKRA